MRIAVISFAFLLILGGAVNAGDGNASKDQPVKFKITAKRADDAVEVHEDVGKVVFDVQSPFGISQAVIERREEDWPKAVILRLRLKGLSSFRVSNGKLTVDAAVSMEDGATKVRCWKDGEEDVALDEKSAFRMDVRVVGGDGKSAKELPLKDGYFEITPPAALFGGNPKSITINWIDFYR